MSAGNKVNKMEPRSIYYFLMVCPRKSFIKAEMGVDPQASDTNVEKIYTKK